MCTVRYKHLDDEEMKELIHLTQEVIECCPKAYYWPGDGACNECAEKLRRIEGLVDKGGERLTGK